MSDIVGGCSDVPAHDAQDYSLGPYFRPVEHYTLLSHVLALNPTGTALEFGVGAGTSTRLIAEHMPVIGFDSGLGLPEDWRPPEFNKGAFACEPPSIPNAQIVKGWFEDTLPEFDFDAVDIGLVHVDCDLYSSTATALKHIGPHLTSGCYIVFDEWHAYAGCEDHEQKAFKEFADRSGISWTVVGHSFEQWAIRIA